MLKGEEKDIFSERLYGLVYNWKGLKEENSVYTAEQLAELDDDYEPTATEFEGAIAANKTYIVYLLNGENREQTISNVRSFMTGGKNDDPSYNGEGWYWETVTENFFTGAENPTTQKLIAELQLNESDLRMQEYRQIVMANVTEEYNEFRKEELQKSKEQIFDDYYRIHVYEELKEFLTAEEPQMDEKHYRCLAADGKSVLSLLYDDYLDREYSSITTWEDIRDFVTTYNEDLHKDILEGGAEIE